MLIALKRIAADKFGEAVGLMGVGGADRTHLVQDDVDPALRQLPRGFGAGKATADDYDTGPQILF
jgi:hypothetical protein